MKRLALPAILAAAALVGCETATPIAPSGPETDPVGGGSSSLTQVPDPLGSWELTRFVLDGTDLAVSDPAKYTATFTDDGRVSLRVDCNSCNGTYETDGTNIMVSELLACTLAACVQPSLEREYLGAITGATSYQRNGDELTLLSESATLGFTGR